MKKTKKRLLIIGAGGMLGSTLFRYFVARNEYNVTGTVRSVSPLAGFVTLNNCNLISNVDVENSDHLLRVFDQVRPDIVVNCVGVVKQLAEAEDALASIPLNSLLPHVLARLCAVVGSRLIHISTDCVFSGQKGEYHENDTPDARDLYGRSKLIGELDYPHALTIRTSLIGHELNGRRSLVNWFLDQEGTVKGFTKAIFSGLPTIEIANVLESHVFNNSKLHGLYHISADPISKYNLLVLINSIYSKNIDIIPDDSLVIDRSLNSTRFREATGYTPAPWPQLIQAMHNFG